FPSGVLSGTTIVCEEAHRLVGSGVFRDFVSEARKYVKKLFMIASDPALFGSVCQLVRPPALQELLGDKSLDGEQERPIPPRELRQTSTHKRSLSAKSVSGVARSALAAGAVFRERKSGASEWLL